VELLNDKNRVIGNSGNITLGRFCFGERSTMVSNRADIRQFVFTVKADDITDQMSMRMEVDLRNPITTMGARRGHTL